jgi:hypothetical protein
MARKRAIDTFEGSHDSGENITFTGGVITSPQGVAIHNPGNFAFFLHSVSMDFPKQWYVGRGQIEFHGCWLEKNANPDPSIYLFDVTGGTVQMYGGRIQVDGTHVDAAEAPFRLARGSRMKLQDVNLSNFGSTSDVMAVGEGTFTSRGMLGGAQTPLLSMRSDDQNIFGSGGSENGKLALDCWVDSVGIGSATEQTDRHNVAWKVSGAFTGSTIIGFDEITGTSTAPSSAAVGDIVSGPGIPVGTVISAINNQSIAANNLAPHYMRLTSKLTVTNAAASLRYTRPTSLGSAGVHHSVAEARSGGASIRVFKTGSLGNGNAARLNILYPISDIARTAFELFYKIGAVPGAPVNSRSNVYFSAYFANIIQNGSEKTPVVAQSMFAGLDAPQNYDRQSGKKVVANVIQSDEWNRINFTTAYVDPNGLHDGFPPAWATHLWIRVDLVSAPAPFEIFLDDLCASLL